MPLPRLTLDDILGSGFSTPWGAPLVPPFPFSFRDARILTAVYRSDPDRIAALLPPPLEPAGDRVMVHVYDMVDTDWLGHYQECNVMVGCRLPDGTDAAYSPFLFLSSDVGVAHGREVHGQPKKGGHPWLEARSDLFVAGVERNGIDVLTATLPYKQERADLSELADVMDFAVNVNLKAVDHIDGRPAIRQLTSRRLTDVVVHECWRGRATVELRPNAQAPVHVLPVVEMGPGWYWRADFTLVEGHVVHDYIEARGGANG